MSSPAEMLMAFWLYLSSFLFLSWLSDSIHYGLELESNVVVDNSIIGIHTD